MNIAMYLAASSGEANGAGCFIVGALFLLGLGIFAGRQQKNNHRR